MDKVQEAKDKIKSLQDELAVAWKELGQALQEQEAARKAAKGGNNGTTLHKTV